MAIQDIPSALADVVDGDDGRVIEGRGGAGLGFKPPAAGLVADQHCLVTLTATARPSRVLPFPVDLAHAPGAEQGLESDGPE